MKHSVEGVTVGYVIAVIDKTQQIACLLLMIEHDESIDKQIARVGVTRDR